MALEEIAASSLIFLEGEWGDCVVQCHMPLDGGVLDSEELENACPPLLFPSVAIVSGDRWVGGAGEIVRLNIRRSFLRCCVVPLCWHFRVGRGALICLRFLVGSLALSAILLLVCWLCVRLPCWCVGYACGYRVGGVAVLAIILLACWVCVLFAC